MIRVDYDAVAFLAASLRGLGSSSTQAAVNARDYARDNVTLPRADAGLAYGIVQDTARTVEQSLATWTGDTEKALLGGADCTDGALRAIRAMDAEAVELLSGHYGPADVQTGRERATTAAVTTLVPAKPDTDFDSIWQGLGFIGNRISVSYWLGAGLDAALDYFVGQGGYNVFDEIPRHLVGDWEKVSTASDGLAHLAAYFGLVAHELSGTWASVDSDWDGETATAAGRALLETARSLNDVAEALAKVSSEYNAVAVGVYMTADLVTGLMHELADWLIAAGIAAVVGTATIETGVGALAGYAAAAIFVARAVVIATRIGVALSAAVSIAEAFAGPCIMILGATSGVSPVTVAPCTF